MFHFLQIMLETISILKVQPNAALIKKKRVGNLRLFKHDDWLFAVYISRVISTVQDWSRKGIQHRHKTSFESKTCVQVSPNRCESHVGHRRYVLI